MIAPRVEDFLDRLESALHGLRQRERARALREARDHLLCAAADREARGTGHAEAVRSAIEAFGDVESIAASYARTPRSRAEMVTAGGLAVVAVGSRWRSHLPAVASGRS